MTAQSWTTHAQDAAWRALADGLRPDPWIDLETWSERYAVLGKDSPQPGPYRTAAAPYVRGPMRWLSRQDPAQRIVLMWASQLSKSTVANLALAYYAHTSPRGQMVVQPTIDLVEQYHRQRLEQLWASSPVLREIFPSRKSRDADATLRSRDFRGGYLRLSGANSPGSLSSTPIGDVLCDEISQWQVDLSDQGAPLAIVAARTSNFRDRKEILTGTPTVEGACAVEREFARTDQHYYWVPCPHCQLMQRLRWRDDDGTYRVQWTDHDPQSAVYVCSNGCVIRDHERVAALALGEWRAERPELSSGGLVRGAHLSALYSPWLSLAKLASEWVNAAGNPELLKAFVNTRLAETWKDQGSDGLKAEALRQRVEQYTHAPDHVQLLTAGVDVQNDRLEVAVWGWGAGEESWLVDYQVIQAPTDTDAPWRLLADVLGRGYQVGARRRRIRAACVDTGGHRTDRAYAFCAEHDGRIAGGGNVWAIKGSSDPSALVWPRKPTRIRRKAFKLALHIVGVNQAKDTVTGRLRLPAGGAGSMHFPAQVAGIGELTDAWFAQLTSERKRTVRRSGRTVMVWELPDKKRNEALDCTVYAYAALCGLTRSGMRLVASKRSDPTPMQVVSDVSAVETSDLKQPEQQAEQPITAQAVPTPKPKQAKPKARPRGMGWLTPGGMRR